MSITGDPVLPPVHYLIGQSPFFPFEPAEQNSLVEAERTVLTAGYGCGKTIMAFALLLHELRHALCHDASTSRLSQHEFAQRIAQCVVGQEIVSFLDAVTPVTMATVQKAK